MSLAVYLLLAVLVFNVTKYASGHGRMRDPASRVSGWRDGFPMPINYDDHAMYCGGREFQWDQNGGKCGICGDPWTENRNYERPNGRMAQHKIITATYLENAIIRINLEITVSHMGWHEFRICDVETSGRVEATQDCLDKNILADENGNTRFSKGTTEPGWYEYSLVLPQGLVCKHCVIQWKWKCGNDYGCFNNGVCCVGCGDRQEEYYGCSDVTINPSNTSTETTSTSTATTTSTPTTATTSTIATSRITDTTTATTSQLITLMISSTHPQKVTDASTTTVPTTTILATTTSTTATPTITSTTPTSPSTTTTTAETKSPIIFDNRYRFEQIKNNRNNTPTNNSIMFPGRNNNNNGDNTLNVNRETGDAFLNQVFNRAPFQTSNKADTHASVPLAKSNSSSLNDE